MKRILAVVVLVFAASPAWAQFSALARSGKRPPQNDEIRISEVEERQLGAAVSAKIRQRFGVVQDAAVHTYVSAVGLLVAAESSRPELPWKFIVLDTDGVNAFAAPDGYIHITRGALGLIHNEAELAGVLGHEITHVIGNHALNAIRKNTAVETRTSQTAGGRALYLDKLASSLYEMLLASSVDRGDEQQADLTAIALGATVGYAPHALADFLTRLDVRNTGQAQKNGLFSSHQEMQDRITKIEAEIAAKKLRATALVEARYRQTISYRVKPLTEIAQVQEGSAGAVTGFGSLSKSGDKKDDTGGEQPKDKKGFGLDSLKQKVAAEQQSAQVAASGGARGVRPDGAAKGGPNSKIVSVTVTAADLAAFKKGIA